MPRRPLSATSPYWVIGMSHREPWVALAQTNLGLTMAPCGVNRGAALRACGHWRHLTDRGLPLSATSGFAVGAAVIDPAGEVVRAWGEAPTPGGTSRWVPLMRLNLPAPIRCLSCQAQRWQGCWVAVDLSGCSACLPGQEAADPRRWPDEPRPPDAPTLKPDEPRPPDAPTLRLPAARSRPRSNAGRVAGGRRALVVASPEQGRLV
jgi:hypothetical protein